VTDTNPNDTTYILEMENRVITRISAHRDVRRVPGTVQKFFILDRRDDGVLLAQAHTYGDSIKLSVENHRALGQFLKTVGADPKNEVLILTGAGRDWMMGSDPQGFEIEENDLEYWAYEYAYKDGRTTIGGGGSSSSTYTY
jgi:hypothetical protein